MFDNYFWMNKPTLQLVADHLARIAADLESEKRTRADSNNNLLQSVEGLRNDMRSYFHGDGDADKPGIIIELDRLKQNEIRKQKQGYWMWSILVGIVIVVGGKIAYDFILIYPQIAQ